MKILTFVELKSLKGVPYTRRHLRDLCEGGKFPKPVPVSSARIGWVEEEVDAWLAEKVAQRDDGAAPRLPHTGVAAQRSAQDKSSLRRMSEAAGVPAIARSPFPAGPRAR